MPFPFPLELFPFPFPFPLVTQNYSHSCGNPTGIPWEGEFPFPCTPLLGSSKGCQRSLSARLDRLL